MGNGAFRFAAGLLLVATLFTACSGEDDERIRNLEATIAALNPNAPSSATPASTDNTTNQGNQGTDAASVARRAVQSLINHDVAGFLEEVRPGRDDLGSNLRQTSRLSDCRGSRSSQPSRFSDVHRRLWHWLHNGRGRFCSTEYG